MWVCARLMMRECCTMLVTLVSCAKPSMCDVYTLSGCIVDRDKLIKKGGVTIDCHTVDRLQSIVLFLSFKKFNDSLTAKTMGVYNVVLGGVWGTYGFPCYQGRGAGRHLGAARQRALLIPNFK